MNFEFLDSIVSGSTTCENHIKLIINGLRNHQKWAMECKQILESSILKWKVN